MEKKRLVLIECLNSLFDDSKIQSLLAYQLGMYFICQLSRQDLNCEYICWTYETTEELGDHFSIFLAREKLSNSSISDAVSKLEDACFILRDRVDPTPEEVQEGYRNKKHLEIYLPIQVWCEAFDEPDAVE